MQVAPNSEGEFLGDYEALVAGGNTANSFSNFFAESVSTSTPSVIFYRGTTPPNTLSLTNFSPPTSVVEGVSTGGTLATFSDDSPDPNINTYTAVVTWGDGTTDTLTAANGGIVSNGSGSFSVVDSHTYAAESSGESFGVAITDNGGGSAGSSATVVVSGPPMVANPGTQNSAVGDSVSLQVEASDLAPGDSWTYSATGLPSGLSINPSTGLITGTITGSASNYSASVTASEAPGTSATQDFTWNVSLLSVTNPGTQNRALGASVSLQIQDSGLPSGDSWSYSASGLPSGLSINPGTGLISGTITGSPQTYSASVTASDGQGASASQSFTWNVGPTTTTLTSSVDPSDYGQRVTFTATVAAVVTGSGKPTGSVEFLDGTTVLSTVTLNTAAKASYTTTAFTLPVGGDSITAVYLGSTKFETSTSNVITQTVNADPTTTTVKSSVTTAVVGQSVTLTATVTSKSPGSGTPTGTVTFFDGNTPLGPGTLNSSGKATFVTKSLPLGSNSITASYSGDGNYQPSPSGAVSVSINPAATKTVVATSGSPSTFGQNATFTATVTVKTPGSGTPSGNCRVPGWNQRDRHRLAEWRRPGDLLDVHARRR